MSAMNSGIASQFIRLFGGILVASHLLLVACSDGSGPTDPGHDDPSPSKPRPSDPGPSEPGPVPPSSHQPIPAYFYEVHITHTSNTCGAADPGSFEFLVLPERTGDSYTLYGITENQEPVTVKADTMTFSVTGEIEDGSMTVGGRWIFEAERHGFGGTTEFQVNLSGRQPCTFTFATTGTHDLSLDSPDEGTVHDSSHSVRMSSLSGLSTGAAAKPMGPGASASSQLSTSMSRMQSSGADPAAGVATWGDVGAVLMYPNECWTAGRGRVEEASIFFKAPFPQSRTSGTERVYFRYTLYGVQSYDAAQLGVLNETLQPFQPDNVVLESGWWFANVSPGGSFFEQMFGTRPWVDYQTQTCLQLLIPIEGLPARH
jgi:hypothetical protein